MHLYIYWIFTFEDMFRYVEWGGRRTSSSLFLSFISSVGIVSTHPHLIQIGFTRVELLSGRDSVEGPR